MKALIVHLSDLHLDVEAPLSNGAQDLVVSAVQNLDYDLEGIVVIVSGDLALTGSEEQYLYAWEFLEGLDKKLRSGIRGDPNLHWAVVPGNHDCNFTSDASVRDIVINDIIANPTLADQAKIDCCLEPLGNYYSFERAFLGEDGTQDAGWLWRNLQFPVGESTLAVHCINTAWMSRLEETPGSLIVLPSVLDSGIPNAAVSIGVLHHPYYWLHPDNGRELRRHLEDTCDIILTGHQHDADQRLQVRASGEKNEYLEGGAFAGARVRRSEFNVVLLDTSESLQQYIHFQLDASSDHYVRGRASSTEWQRYQVKAQRAAEQYSLDDDFAAFLEEPGLDLRKPDGTPIKLSEVYLYPDLTRRDLISGQTERVGSDAVLDKLDEEKRVLVVGPAQSGKTALSKKLFIDFHSRGYVPLWIDGAAWRPSKGDGLYRQLCSVTLQQQYASSDVEGFRQLDRARKVVIVDNCHLLGSKHTSAAEVVGRLMKFADRIVLLGDDVTHQLHAFVDSTSEEGSAELRQYRIRQFGHELRDRLIERWLTFGEDLSAHDPERLVARLEEMKRTIDTVIGRNFVPAYPIFLLSLLQGESASQPVDLKASTHGYFYEILVRAALAREATSGEFDVRVAYLAHVAYALFASGERRVSEDRLRQVHDEYNRIYDQRLGYEAIVRELLKRRILVRHADRVEFKYDYVYYYFVARYITDHLSESEIRDTVGGLASRLYLEESANILLFLTHLSKDPLVIRSILDSAVTSFRDVEPMSGGEDVAFLNGLQVSLERMEFEDREDPLDSRRRVLRKRDQVEAEDGEESEESRGDIRRREGGGEPLELGELLAEVEHSVRSLQLLGQILKNFPGSLRGETKEEVLRECYGVGRRLLGFFFRLVERDERELVVAAAERLREAEPDVTRRELEKKVAKTLFGIAEFLGAGIVRRVAYSVGSDDLWPTYRRVREGDDSPIVQLFDCSIHLDHSGTFPEGYVLDLARELESNLLMESILRDLVVEHLYMYPVDFRIKQKVCEALNVSYKRIREYDRGARLLSGGD